MSRRWDKWVAQLVVKAGLLALIEKLESRQENVLRILAYHRIGWPEGEDGKLDPSLLSATPVSFVEQMQFLSNHYHVVSIEELLAALSSGPKLPPRSVMVTFDDAYRDFLEHAWPVLERLRLPAVLFVATDYPGDARRSFWWDQVSQAISRTEKSELALPDVGTWPLASPEQRSQAFEEVKRHIKGLQHQQAVALVDRIANVLNVSINGNGAVLNWDEIRELHSQGLCIGAHTRSHPLLSRITLEQARQEISGAQQDLQRELGSFWPVFAYPSGHEADLRPELSTLLRESGIKVAITMVEGHNLIGRTDPLRLRRVGMAPHLSLGEFRLALTGIYSVYGAFLRLRSLS